MKDDVVHLRRPVIKKPRLVAAFRVVKYRAIPVHITIRANSKNGLGADNLSRIKSNYVQLAISRIASINGLTGTYFCAGTPLATRPPRSKPLHTIRIPYIRTAKKEINPELGAKRLHGSARYLWLVLRSEPALALLRWYKKPGATASNFCVVPPRRSSSSNIEDYKE